MIYNLERVKDKDEASRARLIEKPNILELVFIWGSGEANNNHEEVLEGLQPHKNIKSLTIGGFSGTYFPLWTLAKTSDKKFKFDNLIEIKLLGCDRCQEIPSLGHLPMLKILVLKGLIKISSLSHFFYYPHGGNEPSSTDCGRKPPPFAALERLTLAKMINLVEWIAPTVYGSRCDAFPKLEYLEIEACPKMIIPRILDFPSLKELRVDSVDCGSLSLENIYVRSLLSLEIMYIGGLTCLPEGLLYNSQCLESLKIEGCLSLTHLEFPDNAHNFRSLQELRIIGCHNVESIRYSNGEFISLRTLRIHQCDGLRDISSTILESCTSLENLEISKCDRLGSFSLDCQKMPRLYDLSIIKCPKLRSLPKNIDRLCHLRKLSIGPFSEEEGLISLSETLKSVQGLQSLQELVLYGLRKWESLPDQLQHLNALTRLELVEFGIQVLPEWLWNLSSLRVIYILDCYMLRHLPPKEVMQRLTQLTFISIKGSPQLKRFEGSQATRHPIVFHQN